MPLNNQIRRLAVIGAGPSGLASVKYLLEEKYFEQIDVFEQRSSVGGIWNYTPSSLKNEQLATAPQLTPHESLEKPIWGNKSGGAKEAIFISPLYDRLETNIPKELMRYSDKPFPKEAQLFPKHNTVKEYLDEYASDIRSLIQFQTQVKEVKLRDSKLSTWDLKTTNLHTGIDTIKTYDSVVVASGRFAVPYLPDIAGIKDWDKSYPGVISHSKLYDSPEIFRGKKVVVVGGAASGLDIGAQISEVSKGKILMSQQSESYLAVSAPSDRIIHPEIVEFLAPEKHDRAIRFANGHIEDEIDAIVFCTGYLYSYPFLSTLQPSVVTDGWRTRNVYQHMFYTEHPTLIFPELLQQAIPYPMAENQAAVFSRVLSGRLQLPKKAHMEKWEESEIVQKGEGKAFHVLQFPADVNHMNFLHDWAAKAEPRPGLVNNGNGKYGSYWGDRERWMRETFPEMRRAFIQLGEQRSDIKTIEELGTDFDAWKRNQVNGAV
ncbi:hypothetical protein N7495_001248 [Penicillium taxi]|uniref:uncharacterized protein n=1 Tax=Penicillium taxi TaxID=168475 RepID=UPI002544E761|nr:uncharacterized protein N7495_001248 [Penicillium taxi]KAJ5908566.1 hypothetical protein N7495_001248 [Penicillium taxi]